MVIPFSIILWTGAPFFSAPGVRQHSVWNSDHVFSSVMLDAAITWEFKRTGEISSSKLCIQPSAFRAPSAQFLMFLKVLWWTPPVLLWHANSFLYLCFIFYCLESEEDFRVVQCELWITVEGIYFPPGPELLSFMSLKSTKAFCIPAHKWSIYTLGQTIIQERLRRLFIYSSLIKMVQTPKWRSDKAITKTNLVTYHKRKALQTWRLQQYPSGEKKINFHIHFPKTSIVTLLYTQWEADINLFKWQSSNLGWWWLGTALGSFGEGKTHDYAGSWSKSRKSGFVVGAT